MLNSEINNILKIIIGFAFSNTQTKNLSSLLVKIVNKKINLNLRICNKLLWK